MMIRINLLPVRQVLRKRQGRHALVAYAAMVLLALAANFFWYYQRDVEVQQTNGRIAETRERIEKLDRAIGQVANINKMKKDIDDKLAVLETLKKGRMGPVKMLDALASATPKRVVLKEFEEQANQVKISGEASSHEDVAEFMTALASMVWTPRGLGTRSKETDSVRMLADGSAIPFPKNEIIHLFSDILPLKSETVSPSTSATRQKQVSFELKLLSNYAL